MNHAARVFAASDEIRSNFSHALSEMYRAEVPLYGDLIRIVEDINARVLAEDAEAAADLRRSGELPRLSEERHGAIRLGTPQELAMMRRAFAVMGMRPVGYYDLAAAGVPVHATAFRPVEGDALLRSPFRVFTSLLRLDLIEDEALRDIAADTLAARRIFSDTAVSLIELAERQGGLGETDAALFVSALLDTFRWHDEAAVDAETYAGLHRAHRLIADVVCFRGPHINHLTPRTLDIDAAQAEMRRRGMGAKAVIEGPPRRRVPILLRQTSFKAIEETIRFAGAEMGAHTARFGEIEQRGLALTPKGRALYDDLLQKSQVAGASSGDDPYRKLSEVFEDFPDSVEALRRQRLAYFRYVATAAGLEAARSSPLNGELEDWITAGLVSVHPIVYEDFLPVSAAGIFQSNLGADEQRRYRGEAGKEAFEQALGDEVLDEFRLYDDVEQASIRMVRSELGSGSASSAAE